MVYQLPAQTYFHQKDMIGCDMVMLNLDFYSYLVY